MKTKIFTSAKKLLVAALTLFFMNGYVLAQGNGQGQGQGQGNVPPGFCNNIQSCIDSGGVVIPPDEDWIVDSFGNMINVNSGNVGIGTTTPSEKLEVDGNVHASGTISSGNTIIINGTQVGPFTGTDLFEARTGVLAIGKNSTNLAQFRQISLGIGIFAPATNLHVNGQGVVSSLYTNAGNTSGFEIGITAGGVASLSQNDVGKDMKLSTGGGERIRILSTGEVGIGTNAPVNSVEISSGVAPATLNPTTATSPTRSGLRFTDLKATMDVDATANSTNTILSVNDGGDVILVNDQTVANPPSAPTLLSPADGAGVDFCVWGPDKRGNVDLQWQQISEPLVFYEVQLATDNAFTNIVGITSVMNDDNFTLGICLDIITYYWRVRAITAGGTSNWSVFSFTNTSQCCSPPPEPPPGPSVPSDLRYKKNITNIDSALYKIKQLRGVSFDWKIADYPELHFDSTRYIGFIAQEVAPIVPEVVYQDDSGYYSLNYERMVSLLAEGIKELAARDSVKQTIIDSLVNKVNSHDQQLAAIQSCLDDLGCGGGGPMMKTGNGNGNAGYSINSSFKIVPDNSLYGKNNQLYQNQPNPFRYSTKFSYSIGTPGNVELIITTYTGQYVTTLVNEHRDNGSYSIDWDSTDIAPGLYFYTLKVDGMEWVKKAIRVK